MHNLALYALTTHMSIKYILNFQILLLIKQL